MAFQEEVVLTIYVVPDAKMGTVRTRSVHTFIPPQKPQIVFNSEFEISQRACELKRPTRYSAATQPHPAQEVEKAWV
jgi:hypothetical protein